VNGALAYQAGSVEVASAIELSVIGKMPSGYPTPPPLETGSGQTVPAPVPCVLVKAIGYVEGSWRQAAGSVPAGSTGPVKQSGSCGYGIMQITSGMRNPDELPADVQAHIASDYRYNIAYGARLFADKWNAGDFLGAVVGNRDPNIAEDWYYATWSYNNFAFRNNPNNPDYPWPRPAFDGSQSRTNYPYQELVFGLAAHPPLEGGRPLWDAVPLTLPPREGITNPPGPILEPSPSHTSLCRTIWSDPASLEVRASPDGAAVTRQVNLAGTASSAAWQAIGSATWLRVAAGSTAGLPGQATVVIDPKGMRPGSYSAALVVSAAAGGYSTLYLPVTLTIEGSAATRFFFPWLPRSFRGR
jgi:hypothetical protein